MAKLTDPSSLPTGTVTFLFTDIEGSTKLLQQTGTGYPAMLERHSGILRECFARHDGRVVSTEGDSFFVVFRSAASAVRSAVEAQRLLASTAFGDAVEVRVRMGLHTGEGVLGGDNYAGIDVNKAARVAASAHGGQVVMTSATAGLIDTALREGVTLRDLGQHRLKDLTGPQQIFQLVVPGLRSSFPPLRSTGSRPNNLPVQLTSFVGRRPLIQRVLELLRQHRLVTLTGPGGTGKTRLSLEVAAEALSELPNGVFFVPLAPITNPALVYPTIAKSLGLQEKGNTTIAELLEEYLQDKQLLLVLDNFEQLFEAAGQVSHLLQTAPGCKALISSRAVLHISGEVDFPVPPLDLPSYKRLPPLEALSQYEGVALFIQRASAVKPGFAISNDNASAVAEICSRLDGLPLAIELAAARVRVLSPQSILNRLEERLKFLTGGAVDLPARQQTLRNAIAWSYDLLSEPEQALFRSLSVFRGGISLEKAELVASPGGHGDIVDLIISLADKSLIRSGETAGGEPRFTMLETIQEFGREMVKAQGEEHELKSRHARVFAELAEDAFPETGASQVEWLDGLELELDNIRAALRFLFDSSDAHSGLRLAGAIWRFWHLRGHLAEGRQWLGDFLNLPEATGHPAVAASALYALASLAYWQSDFVTAGRCYREALGLYRELESLPGMADALQSLGFVAAAQEDLPGALDFYRESRDISRTLDNRKAEAWARMGIAMVNSLLSDNQTALREAREALVILRPYNDTFAIANNLTLIVQITREMGQYEAALEELKEATELYSQLGDVSGLTEVLYDIAVISLQRGDWSDAVRFYSTASALRERVGAGPPPAIVKEQDPRIEAAKMLAPEEVAEAEQHGASLSAEEATAEVLKKLQDL